MVKVWNLDELMDKKFEEWTKDRNELGKRINVFNKIKDIPYGVNKTNDAETMLNLNRGHCYPKHALLAHFLNKLNIETKILGYECKWSKLEFLPEKLKELAINHERFVRIGHVFVLARINKTWVRLDVSWDSGLKNAGFPVNEWGGFGNTAHGFEPVGKTTVMNDLSINERNHRSKEMMVFYDSLNEWLESLRRKR
jgi:hypothetical protein